MRDLRQAVNVLLHRPWYTASILTVIGVGIALLSSVLAVVDGVLFKPLGYPGESQLVAMRVSSSQSRSTDVRADDAAAWASAAPGVAFTGFRVWGTDSAFGRAVVLPNFFDVIGVRPAVGGFAPQDFGALQPAIEPRVLTHEAFRSELGGDLGAIGRTVVTNPSTGSGYRIVGVMPRGFVFPYDRLRVGYLAPYVPNPIYWVTNFVARVPPDLTANDVRQRVLAAVVGRSRAGVSTPGPTNPTLDQVDVQPLGRALGAASRPLFTAFLAAAGLLVIVAALNTTSLMAARSLDRRRELSVRRALGARAVDLARLLFLEAALLVGAGTILGLALANPILRVIVPLLPDNLVLFRAAVIDWRVVGFVGVIATAIAGLATVALLRRAIASDARLESSRTVTEPARSTSRRVVVMVQVALALVLTIGGSLLVGSLLSVYAQKEPITAKGVIVIRSNFMDGGPINRVARVIPERAVRVNAVLERLRSVPGVDAAAVVAADFLNGGYSQPWFLKPPTARTTRLVVQGQQVTADYFRVLEPQLVAGRLPTAEEEASSAPVIVVGERVASHYWPDASAVGQTLTDAGVDGQPGQTFTVVGVVKDVRWFSWDSAEVPTIYSPYALTARLPWPTFLIRTSGDTSRATADAIRVMAQTDPLLRTERPSLLEDLFVDTVRQRRFQSWLFGSFAAASLLIVGIGIFGQLAMSTARRTREVGIRMTCGATRASIMRLVVGEQIVPVGVGLLAGAIASAWAVRFVGSYLYQLTASDARVWAASIGLILVTAAAGSLFPAIRASRIDPTRALRAE